MKGVHWTISYTDLARANEEIISDHIRKAQSVILAAWITIVVALGITEYGLEHPSVTTFLLNAGVATLAIGSFYGILVGIRAFAHRKPQAWHLITWGVIWVFLFSGAAYYYLTEGFSDNTLLCLIVFICLVMYRWLMQKTTITYTLTDEGVYEHFRFLGHSQTLVTHWHEVRKHRVHPLTGTVELTLRGHGFHLRPRCHIIVPDRRRRHEIHDYIAPKIWKPHKHTVRRRSAVLSNPSKPA